MTHLNRRTFLGLALVSPWALSAAAGDAPENINEMLAAIRAESGLPAIAAGIMKSGKVLAAGAVGVRKLGTVSPVTLADKFHIGSNTKAMTATLVAMFIEQKKLRWDQTLAEIFPERSTKMNEAYRKVTIEMLLTHTSGAPANNRQYGNERQTMPARRLAYLDAVINAPPEKEPGTQYEYSNAGYIIAGTILERVSGKQWELLIKERLFQPLKMTSAGFGPPSKPGQVDQPWGHVLSGEKFVPRYGDNPLPLGPAGTVHCTIEDYLKFADFHASIGKRPGGLLSPALMEELHTPAAGRTYAKGWGTGKRPWAKGPVLTHTGSNTMNYFVAWIAPKIDLSIAVAANAAGPKVNGTLDKVVGKLIKQFAA